MKKISLLFVVFMLSTLSSAFFINEKIDSVAEKHKGYDEITSNISRIDYAGQGYYLVSFTRNLQYSGSVLLNAEGAPVTDPDINKVFFTAEVLRMNYPKESVGLYTTFSEHYKLIAKELPGNLSEDAYEIASLLDLSAASLTESLNIFSPDSAEKYLVTDEKILLKIPEAQKHLSESNINTDSGAAYEYKQSLTALFNELTANRKNLLSATGFLESNAQSKITGEQKKNDFEFGMNAAIGVLAVIIVIGVWLKKTHKI